MLIRLYLYTAKKAKERVLGVKPKTAYAKVAARRLKAYKAKGLM